MTSPKTIFVTGVAGFIGSSFAREFQERYPETKVVGIDNLSSGRRDAIPERVTFYEGSITDAELVDSIFKKHAPEYVFHFAAVPRVSYSVEHPAETTYANVYGSALLIEKARDYKVKRFVYSSSSSVYGDSAKLPTKEDENPPNPVSPYALQKYAVEPLLRMASKLYGMDTVSLRYFNVFGPGQYGDSPYSTVISAWLTGLYFPDTKKPFLEGDGGQSKDYCFIENVVEANLLAMNHPKPLCGESFNVAHGEQTSLLEIKQLLEGYTGKPLELERRPTRVGDVRYSLADISKARSVLVYEVKTSFLDGLKKTIEWFEKRTV